MEFLTDLKDIPHNSSVSIYGAGKLGACLEELLRDFRKDVHIVNYIDSYKSGTKGKLSIVPVDKATPDTHGAFVVVASHWWAEIYESIQERFPRILVLHPFLNLGHFFTPQEFEYRMPRMEVAANVFTHAQEQEKYRSLLEQRRMTKERIAAVGNVSGKSFDDICPVFTPYPQGGSVYFDYIHPEYINVVIDGGVYDGHETLRFLEMLPQDGLLYGFEPFYDAYLQSPYRERIESDGRATILPLGLWEERGSMSLQPDGPGTCLVQGAEAASGPVVGVKSLDEFAGQVPKPIDFIKLDVESAELPVLRGAIRTLRRDRPQLAVCLYHTKFDMIEIPIYLNAVLENYEFRIGHYSTTIYDTVLYAIPKEKS